MTQSTQQQYPWRATLRTVLAVLIPAILAAPEIVAAITQDEPGRATGILGLIVVVSGAITRIMAVPAVDRALARIGLGSAGQ